MKRTLLFFVSLFVMTLSAMAGDVVLSWSSAADWAKVGDDLSFTKDGYTLLMQKNTADNPPFYSDKAGDVRVYNNGVFKLTSANGNMTKVVINISSDGKKFLGEYEASTGTAVVDKDALTVT